MIRGKAMANYPWELAQDAAYQSHTSRLTELWSLPRPAQGLSTNNNNKKIMITSVIFIVIVAHNFVMIVVVVVVVL